MPYWMLSLHQVYDTGHKDGDQAASESQAGADVQIDCLVFQAPEPAEGEGE